MLTILLMEVPIDNEANLDIDTQQTENKLNADLQRYILDTDALHLAFYQAFCGWQIDAKKVKEEFLGSEREVIKKEYKINQNARIMNESGADYLFNSLLPLIAQTTTTSNLPYKIIYKMWNGRLDAITFALLDSIYLEGNPYELKQHRIPDVISTLTSLANITMKALEGFTLRQITETFISTYLQKQNVSETQGKGLLDNLKKSMGFKQ